MKPLKYTAILVLSLAVFLAFVPTSFARQFKIVKVYDGDTVRAKGTGNEIKVQLKGIDAPEICPNKQELGQPFGLEARSYLSSLILNKSVEIEGTVMLGKDLFAGEIMLDGQSVNLKMVEAGLAEARPEYPRYRTMNKAFLDAEKVAKASKAGMWIQGKDYLSPCHWRRQTKAKAACALILYGLCDHNEK